MSKLCLVPTPIGNLGDITLRALEYLKSADAVYAEDTRHSSKLFKHFGIDQRAIPFHQHNEHKVLDRVVANIASADLSVLISDAGTPGISDPGFLLVRKCIEEGIEIETLPGPTAIIPALVSSGFPCERFCFEGFLPPKKGRQTRIEKFLTEERTIVLYESPHRLLRTLKQFKEILGPERLVCVAREISKIHEEYFRSTIEEALIHYETNKAKGEIVIVLEGARKK